jgi:predicted transposase YbfD/YdcC
VAAAASLLFSREQLASYSLRSRPAQAELDWTLDVTFRQDQCRIRKDHAPQNLANIRRFALNMLKQDPLKISIKRKRFKALINPTYRSQILAY